MACSQNRRCQIPVSRLCTWLLDLNCAVGSSRENPLLIWLRRVAKSASPGGSVEDTGRDNVAIHIRGCASDDDIRADLIARCQRDRSGDALEVAVRGVE